MFLALNVGNTHVVPGVFDGDKLIKTWRLRSDPARPRDEYRLLLRQLLEEEGMDFSQIDGCMISSVIPRLSFTLRDALEPVVKVPVMDLHCRLDLGFQILYRHPEDVGPDRLADAVGGIARYGAPLIVVDFGTATTFNIITPQSEYLGGVIMPGLEMSADALFQKTSRLPRVAVAPPEKVIGRSTFEAIASGIVWGTIAAIDGLADKIRAELGLPECRVVATGGNAATLSSHSRVISEVNPDLTLYGILIAWRRNQGR
jgi:type III pantothenate kinase